VLSLAVAEALELSCEDLKQAPLAIELFHVGSLIHDDLPSIDDDDFRIASKNSSAPRNEA
jgi:geranylgeranyl diphosphate synthase type II